jgi:hypothetical protein
LEEKRSVKVEIVEKESERLLETFNTNVFISKLKERGAK